MADAPRRQFTLEELTPVFAAQERLGQRCILMGGQSVCFWAKRFMSSEAALSELERESAFLSKDVDFQGDRAAAIALARALGERAELPSFRDAFGNLMSGKFTIPIGGDRLNVEVLRKVQGLTPHLTEQLAMLQPLAGKTLRVLNPLGVVMAKSWNVVNIAKEGRNDVEQLFTAVICLRAFYRELLVFSESDRSALRPTLKLVETGLRFTELPAGRKTAETCGVDWSQIIPHAYLAASAQPELIRLREKRIPDWLAQVTSYPRPVPVSDTHRRMLEILADHAEPLCVRPAADRRGSRISHHTSRHA
jgi:hypothetical protein